MHFSPFFTTKKGLLAYQPRPACLALPLQEATVPLFAGNKDVAVDAQTGSGKTLAFVLPVVERLRRLEEPLKKHQASCFSGWKDGLGWAAGRGSAQARCSARCCAGVAGGGTAAATGGAPRCADPLSRRVVWDGWMVVGLWWVGWVGRLAGGESSEMRACVLAVLERLFAGGGALQIAPGVLLL